ncbi:hypothetical protein HBB16_09880 [Pseudonocardia sp. MCCB 268]|nr:hypothetical protein [Pseudonocardia cytotoxica]
MCKGPEWPPRPTSLLDRRTPLLSAARYASNHAIHQLILLADLDRSGRIIQ